MDSVVPFVDKVLEKLDREGILQHLIVVGSWCVYFYKHQFKDAFRLTSWRTKDIEFDTSLIGKLQKPRNITAILKGLDFVMKLHGDAGYTTFEHPDIIVEFLVPQKGDGIADRYRLPGFGIHPQPIRYLSFLVKDVMTIEYKGLSVKVPHPANFAVHKLMISIERKDPEKARKDREQALATWNMVVELGDKERLITLCSGLSKKQRKSVKAALTIVNEIDKLEEISTGTFSV